MKHTIIEEINKLRKEKNVIILAHLYQIPEIQDLADIIGDSLALSKAAAEVDADIIVFCGVGFMAETAKILSPDKKVLIPNIDAGCPMADMVTREQLIDYKEKNPDTAIVTYVNSSAEVKAESTICCTSSNALDIVKNLEYDKILFAPDKNLGGYIAKQLPEKQIELWRGFCIVHERIAVEDVKEQKEAHPNALFIAHPECNEKVLEYADFIGSTSQLINYVKNSSEKEFIIGTEQGVIHQLERENPNKKFYLASESLLCTNMKKITLENLRDCLKYEQYEMTLDEDIMSKAYVALDRMLKSR